jgi:glycosyltransferase involved in cell wall biosynthesis
VKLAVVTPRYGRDVMGGAETAARQLSLRLAARADWDVEVLTTVALDAATWAPALEPGEEVDEGVRVRRFPVRGARHPDFDRITERTLRHPQLSTLEEQHRWLEAQGPVAPELVDAVAATDAEVVAFHPYLYHPTVAGVPHVASRAVLHPALHDEAPLRLPIYRELFEQAAGFVFWSEAERRFAQRRFPVASRRQLVLGLGVEPMPGDAGAARAAAGLDGRPYLLCLGRVDDGKGARVLYECFAAYKQRRPGPLALVFAGPVVHPPPEHPDVIVTGPVDDPVKWGLLRGAHALVSPSAYESFSIVLLEAWSVGTAALVNGRCDVTREHAERSGGALAFSSYAELEVSLDRLLASAALRAELGARGEQYVRTHYRWPDLVERYGAFLSAIARGVR